jgi:hypothetical protein
MLLVRFGQLSKIFLIMNKVLHTQRRPRNLCQKIAKKIPSHHIRHNIVTGDATTGDILSEILWHSSPKSVGFKFITSPSSIRLFKMLILIQHSSVPYLNIALVSAIFQLSWTTNICLSIINTTHHPLPCHYVHSSHTSNRLTFFGDQSTVRVIRTQFDHIFRWSEHR